MVDSGTDETRQAEAARRGRKLFGRTLINIFQQELTELCSTLEARDCRHVRCLRPNDEQKPLFFDDKSMLRQCRYSGLLEATRIRRQGYAHRRSLSHFASRYALLLAPEARRRARQVMAGSLKA
ncbi:MYO7B [Symbiodinium pilosum]|uniref:MYO7B protein n=1 Tax=Symbiodinium pilosum TaxID=2952 RepID=A0A812WH70_SYMPI|nr:MYO7B [Symbiodinium pilosum]